MPFSVVLCALNAKYVHASLAPWCLAAGIDAYTNAKAARISHGEAAEQPAKEREEKRAQAVLQPLEDAVLTAHVIEATIREAQQPDVVLRRILAHAPQAVGFSCYIWNIGETLALAARLKAQCPGLPIILGGPEVSYNAAQVLRENHCVDYVLSGEGETSLPALLTCLAQKRQPQEGQIDGLCTRAFTSAPCVLSGEVADPYTPAYLQSVRGRIAYLETSRGCPYSCAFCLSGRCGKPRYFSLEAAYRHILALANSGARVVKFIDRTFNANPRHANAILRFILLHYGVDIPAGMCFHFEIAGDILQEETLALLAQMPAGAVQLEIGLQSFCEETLAAVRRKTDTTRLKQNIRRLVAMGNMHIHIDLIAGLPGEDLTAFGESFDTAYALNAQMLQLGFLKLLHGAAMREEPSAFPCAYSRKPPYEVLHTPWLTAENLHTLTLCEDALERLYNSGRFRETAAYALRATGMRPFTLYCALGRAAQERGLSTHDVSLDDYTAFLHSALAALPGVQPDALRDVMVRDRLATNATARLPAALHVPDPLLKKAVRALAACPKTAPAEGVRRGVALLYGEKQVCFVDITQKHPVTARYILHTVPVDKLLPK